jgi:hypothetical protein
MRLALPGVVAAGVAEVVAVAAVLSVGVVGRVLAEVAAG